MLNFISPHIPSFLKNFYFTLRGPFGSLPDFLVIGAQKSGTTSMYYYLAQHPQIKPALQQEVHYFDKNYQRGLSWYKGHFHVASPSQKSFETSPYYLFHPLAPQRIKSTIKNPVFIILLRNPVDRAFSHYQHETRKGYELLSFEEAVKAERQRLEKEQAKLERLPNYYSFNHQHFSYIARGCYSTQIKTWFEYYKPESFLFIESESFFENPVKGLNRIAQKIGIDNFDDIEIKPHNQGNYAHKIDPLLYTDLQKYFREQNKDLEALTNQSFKWLRA